MTEAQLTIDGRELSLAEVGAAQGIAAASNGATSPEWFEQARAAVRRIVTEPWIDTFTTDYVWTQLGYWQAAYPTFDPNPPEPRAMGAVMRWAIKEGLCYPTDEYRKSERPECHARPVRVWRSR